MRRLLGATLTAHSGSSSILPLLNAQRRTALTVPPSAPFPIQWGLLHALWWVYVAACMHCDGCGSDGGRQGARILLLLGYVGP